MYKSALNDQRSQLCAYLFCMYGFLYCMVNKVCCSNQDCSVTTKVQPS